jgi:hypothetical protein
MKIIEYIKNDMTGGFVAYSIGEIVGWPDDIADRLIQRGFAKLHGDGRPKDVGHRIPDGADSGYWAGAAVAERIAALKAKS